MVQTLSSYQGPADLKLGAGNASQDPGSKTPKTPTTTTGAVEAPVVSGAAKPDAAAGVQVVQDPQQIGVEVIEAADVEGTICDCGELLLPGGAFPKWPLLFLTAVPLVFINDCDDCDENPISTPTPTPPPPTPTPSPVPEPASLLLLGTGLVAAGAGLRRRRNRNSC